jgi:hypothetical protein
MNYTKPEDIKEYVNQSPTGVAGTSEELSAMVNHFVKLAVLESLDVFGRDLPEPGDGRMTEVVDRICRVAEHFAVD